MFHTFCPRGVIRATKGYAHLRTYTYTTSSSSAAALHLEKPRPHVSRFPADPEAANPPSTTRPPPLEVPTRKPESSTVSHLFATGKAYLKFYKTGVKHIWANTNLARAAIREAREGTTTTTTTTMTTTTPPPPPRPGTRAHVLLLHRWRHDIRCLLPFAMILLVFGEFTPIVVLGVPRVVPLTCRIPRQVEKLLRQEENRRKAAFERWEDLRAAAKSASASSTSTSSSLSLSVHDGSGAHDPLMDKSTLAHVARILGLVTRVWDRIGVDPPAGVLRRKVVRRVDFLVRDDTLLLQAGGVAALEDDELRLACIDRGINVLGRSTQELCSLLQVWLDLVAFDQDSTLDDRVERTVLLLTHPQEDWLAAST